MSESILETPTVPSTIEESTDQAEVRPVRQPATPDAGGFVWGTGRRKSAIARVRIRPVKGDKAEFKINGKDLDIYFTEERDQASARKPLRLTNMLDKVDVLVNAHGGGFHGQADAVLLGLSRALVGYDPTLEPALREESMLTRDPREVERKKYGQRGARRRFQFSKR